MKYNGIIFDLDGVLCHTDSYHYQAWKVIADRLGVPFTPKDNDRLRGVSRMESLEIILENYTGEALSAYDKELLAEEKNNLFVKMLDGMSPADLSAETKTALEALRDKGLMLAVGSSSKNAMHILSRIGLDGWFDAVSDGNNIENSKPDPEVFLVAAWLLDLPPSDCLVVEDADAGVIAAARGGFACAAMGSAAANPMAAYKISSPADLPAIV